MIIIYAADIGALAEKSIYDKYFCLIDESRQEKVQRCKNETDRRRSLLAGYLIQFGVKEWILRESGLQADCTPLSLSYAYGSEGKPYLKEYKDIYFNISHSGQYVICGISDCEIGVDIQEHRQIKNGIAHRFFSEQDKEILKGCRDEESETELFFDIWAVKEAYMKLTGEGMKQGMDGSETIFDRKARTRCGFTGKIKDRKMEKDGAYFMICDKIKGYSIAGCSYLEEIGVIFREIPLA